MDGRRAFGIFLLAGLMQPALPVAAGAAVTVTASRLEALYSADKEPDCTTLHGTSDDALPFNVVRLRATVPGGAPAGTRFQWVPPRPAAGMLVADEDIAPNEESPSIAGFCTEFGNSCVLTDDKLPFYNRDTILWLAPKCEALPSRTARNFPGGRVRVGVTVTSGGRRLGKAKLAVGYGHLASVELFADGDDGLGKVDGVASDINPLFSALEDARGNTLPPLEQFIFDNGGGETSSSTTACSLGARRFDACIFNMLYRSAGRFEATVEERFTDGSALCDNLTVRVGTCAAKPVVQVLTAPHRHTYQDGDVVNLRVRLQNRSPREGGCNLLLAGPNVLSCSSSLRIGGTTDTQSTRFDLQHCSTTHDQPCLSDADCKCLDCTDGEFCLTQSHCSGSITRACATDADCRAPLCKTCKPDEHCIRVLTTDTIVVPIGQSIDLLSRQVTVRNALVDPARIAEEWTGTTFNGGSASDTVKYVVRRRRR